MSLQDHLMPFFAKGEAQLKRLNLRLENVTNLNSSMVPAPHRFIFHGLISSSGKIG
jgi:hypothetical protein